MTDGTGTTTYAYNAAAATPTLGAGQLLSVDGPLTNDTIAYAYDELGRVVSRSINGTANQATNGYDTLGRVQSVTNILGNFTYSYVGTTARLQTVAYPNGQTTTFSYFSNTGDKRLQEILNQVPVGTTLSKFDYTYDIVGNITTWTQQTDNTLPAKAYDLTYDATYQLTAAIWHTAENTPTTLRQYV